MCITAIIGMIAAESNDVELQTVLAEHSRLVRKGVPAPEVGPVVARNVYCCPTGKQVLTLEEAVETGRMKGGVALGLGEVVHVVDYIAVPVRSTAEDDEHEVVYLFLVFVVLVDAVSEYENLTGIEAVLDILDKLARSLVVDLMHPSRLHIFL